MESDGNDCRLLSLPRELIFHIFSFLEPQDLIVVEKTSRELSALARDPYVVQSVRFPRHHSSEVFTDFMGDERAAAISNLDLSNYWKPSSQVLEGCIQACSNLTVLRCVNTRLLPTALIRLLSSQLRRLRLLEWSLLESRLHIQDVHCFLDQMPEAGVDCLMPESLQYMYVEAFSASMNITMLGFVLMHCRGLRTLHFHERQQYQPTDAPYAVLRNFIRGTSGRLETFTFTNNSFERGREESEDEEFLHFAPGTLLGMLHSCLKMSPNGTLTQNPRLSASCIALDGAAVMVSAMGHTPRLFAFVNGDPLEALRTVAFPDTSHNVRALTLKASPVRSLVRPTTNATAYQAWFLKFLAGFPNLTELNIASFHFEANVDCCAVFVDAGLDGLRALALPSCALCRTGRLERLALARFKLEEFDVRTMVGGEPQICAVCSEPTTCTDACFRSLTLLGPLQRLTLSDLPHVANLKFLRGCTVGELRIRNAGLWNLKLQEILLNIVMVRQLYLPSIICRSLLGSTFRRLTAGPLVCTFTSIVEE